MPFSVTYSVACFQRTLEQNVEFCGLVEDTYAYLGDLSICGYNLAEHECNLKRFMELAENTNDP